MPTSFGEVTKQLEALRRGDREAEAALADLVYEELHSRARQYMRQERPSHTLQATALVNEAFVKLVRNENIEWQNRAHFLALASMSMRRILIDYARHRRAAKNAGAMQQVELANDHGAIRQTNLIELLALDEALTRLAEMDPRQGRLVELIHFGGLSEAECAEVLGVSVRTVRRDWASARAWLQAQLRRATS